MKTTKDIKDKDKTLDAVLADIEKQFGKGSIMKLGSSEHMEIDTTSTGSLSLDIALGVGGYPKGRIIEIYGPESSGKTTFALQAIAEVQKAGGRAAFIDAEHALDPVYARNLGVDINELLLSQPDTGEQALEKVGVMFGNPETTPGGRALKFYATIRLDVRRGEQIKSGDQVIGNRTNIKIVKNKVAPPFKTASVDIMYGEGVSYEGELIDIASSLDIVEKSGAWYAYNGEKIGQGRENAKQYLKDNPNILEEIDNKIREHYGFKKREATPQLEDEK